MDKFYKMNHRCEDMPQEVSLIQLKISKVTQFSLQQYKENTALNSTTLYGFKFCPYCGERVVVE